MRIMANIYYNKELYILCTSDGPIFYEIFHSKF